MLKLSQNSKRFFAALLGILLIVGQLQPLYLSPLYAAEDEAAVESADETETQETPTEEDATDVQDDDSIDPDSQGSAESGDAEITEPEENTDQEDADVPADPADVPEDETEGDVVVPEDEDVTSEEEGQEDNKDPPEEEIEMLAEDEEPEMLATEIPEPSGKEVLCFTSDTHNKSGNAAANRLGSWLEAVAANEKYGGINVMAFGGDMAGANASGYWDLAQADMDQLSSRKVTGVYTTGNHEISYGGDFNYSSYLSNSYSSSEPKGQFKLDQEVASGQYYRIYCLGSRTSSSSYTNQVSDLTSYLDRVGNDKVIFIITHFPLHSYNGRTTSGADNVIEALNNAVENNHQTIVFLWGHNHTLSDTYYDQIYGPGGIDTITTSSTKTIKFYYGAAGCMSDSEYSGANTGSASVQGKGLVVSITPNRGTATMEFDYLNASGRVVSEDNSIKSVTVTSSDITPASDETTYTLAETMEAGKEYLIATSNSGSGFLLSNEAGSVSNSLKGYGVTVEDEKITIPQDVVDHTLFTASGSDNNSIRLMLGDQYLYADGNGALRMVASISDAGKFWHYKATDNGTDKRLLWFFNGTTGEYGYTATGSYKYYLNTDADGNFTKGYILNEDKISEANTPKIYLYVKDDGSTPVDPPTPSGETVDITPESSNSPEESVSIDVGETLTINVTNGSSNSSYDFVASLTNSSVAQIQGNATVSIAAGATGTFTVKGLAAGTVDITIQNNGQYSNRKGTIHLTVGNGGSTPVDPTADETVSITPTTDNPDESASIAVGETLEIDVTNGSTREAYDFTATLSESNIVEIVGNATVNIASGGTGKFYVTGLKDGTVDVIIQNNGQYSNRIGTIHVTVGSGGDTPPSGEDKTYVPTETLEDGKNYLIVNGNTGSVSIVGNEPTGTGTNTGLKAITATVSDGKITLSAADAAKAEFTAEIKTSQSGAVSAWLEQDGKYLYTASSGGLRISNEQTTNSGITNNTGKFWHYKADGKNLLWYFKDTATSDGYTDTSGSNRYYLNCNNGTYTSANVSNTSLAATNTPAIYLFVEDDGTQPSTVPVTGVALDKDELALTVGETGTLTATVTPNNATNKAVSWTSSDPTVATVNDGVVTAVAEGTATITITTADGGRTATCAVTVNEPAPGEEKTYVLTDTLAAGKNYVIASTNTAGATSILGHSETTAMTYAASIALKDGKLTITTDKADVAFAAAAITNGVSLTNDGYYMTVEGGGDLTFSAESSTKYWAYSNYKLSSNSSNTRYLTFDGTEFKGYYSSSNPNPSNIYIFVEDDGTIPEPVVVTGVTVAPTTATLDVGETVALTATVAPADADNKAVSWSSSNPSVATVSDTGVVTAVTAGTATITVTTVDQGKTATCAITVNEVQPGTTTRYELVNELENGGEYLIVNANSGSAFALKNPGTSGTNIAKADYKTPVAVENGGYILTNSTDIVWTAEASGSGFHLLNGGLYLEGSGGNTSVYSTLNNSNRSWTYSASKQLQMPGGNNSTYTLRYSTSNSYFQGTSSTTTNSYVVYLFKKVGTDPVSDVTLSPTELDLETGETETLTVTVLPSSAANKTVTWTTSNDSVATVDANGVVTAVGAGDATITVTTVDGGKTATCEVHVTAPVTVEYELTDTLVAGQKYLIATSNDGAGFILSNEAGSVSNSLKGYAINVVNGKVSITKAVESSTLFDCEQNATSTDPNYTRITKGGKYLYADNSGALRLADSISDDGKNWHYRAADKYVLWFYNGTNGDYGYTATNVQKYYLQYDTNGNFTKGTVSNTNTVSGTNTPKIYLFVESSGSSHEHTYGTPAYTWSDDNATCTATAVCSGCAEGTEGHSVTETVTASSEVTKAATCEAKGETTYTATFTNSAFVQQIKTIENIDALGHDWDAPTYEWADDNSSVTATRICKNDATHPETETVNTTSAVTTPATCEAKGKTTYTATFTNSAFVQQTKTIENIDALGHDWDAPTYEWAEDNSSVTATRICKNDATHHETETVNTTSAVTTPATCEAKGKTTYTATFTNSAFVQQTKTIENIDALGHDWNDPTYEWAADNSKVTATRTCKRDASHTQTETADTTSEVTKAATCEAKGETTYTATFENPAFKAQTQTVEDIDALGHDWGEWIVTKPATENEEGQETRTCQNDLSHTETRVIPKLNHVHNLTAVAAKDATCTEPGNTAYWICDKGDSPCGKYFSDAEGEHEIDKNSWIIPAKTHNWDAPTYEWDDDYSSVTATRTCKNDLSHTETETVDTTSEVTKAATCEAKGETTYTATFTNAAFAKQTKTIENIDALDHDWDAPTYEWAADNSSVTATRICKNDATHTQTETVDTTSEVTKAATCEAKGETTYTATFTNTAFTKQTKAIENIDALGHDWNDPEYTWAEDNSSVTATRTCKNDASHIETETVNTTSKVTKAATCETDGEKTFTATFTNTAFSAQTKAVDIPHTGHSWGEVVYTWSDDHSSVTAKRVCANDISHNQTETVTTTPTVTTPAACETKGKTTYTATFENPDFKAQTQTFEDIDALGHDWNDPTYEWAADYSKVTATRTCKRDASHTQTETADTTSEVTKAATCEAKGETTYTATFKNPDFKAQTQTVEDIDALGHDWDTPTYEWASDNSKVTATRICKNDTTHTQTETADTTSEVTKAATCETKGETTYTATFTNTAFATQTKAIENIDALGHDWDTPTYEWAADNSSVTATRTCKRNASHTETETADTIPETTKPATCEEAGVTTYTSAAFTNTAFTVQTKEVEIPATGHTWGDVTYTWAEDNSTVTATRTCITDPSHTETEIAQVQTHTTAATCTETGITTYTATFNNTAFTEKTKSVILPSLGHDYGDWVVTIPATCTETGKETRTCSRCDAVLERTIDATGHNLEAHRATAATCTEAGNSLYWSCSYCGKYFNNSIGTSEIEEGSWIIDALGHKWKDPEYTWADDNSTVTAKRICERDDEHFETETADATYAVVTPATDTKPGVGRFTSEAFENEAFEVQTKDIELPPTGYEVTYKWADDNKTIIATATPYDTGAEPIIETVEANYEVTKEPTCTDTGIGTWTSKAFTSAQFMVQTKEVTLDALGHDLVKTDEHAVTCTEDGNTAYWTCSVCGKFFADAEGLTAIEEDSWVIPALGHNFGAWAVNKAPTCTEKGEEIRTCSRCGATETREIAALGHDLTKTDAIAATCTETGNNEYWTCSVCGKFFADEEGKTEIQENSWVTEALGHDFGAWTVKKSPTCTEEGEETRTCSRCDVVETRAIAALGHTLTKTDAKDATCTEDGNSEFWTCSVCGKFFSDADGKTEIAEGSWIIEALGHDWDAPVYSWADDNSTVTAKRVCKRDDTHIETETVETTYEVVTEPTETAPGLGRYTSKAFENEAFEVQTKDVEIEKILPSNYEIDKTSVTIPVNGTEQLALVSPGGSTGKGTWTSADPKIATVDENGLVTAKKYGKTTIHVKMDNGYEADCTVQTLFSDVADKTAYFYNAVYWAADHDPVITQGYNLEYFGVGNACLRKEFILFLYRLAGNPSVSSADLKAIDKKFSDVKNESATFRKAIAWGVKNGIINGYTSGALAGTFGPERTVTRREAVLMLWRYAGKPSAKETKLFNSFTDVSGKFSKKSDTYKAIMWAAETGISKGYSKQSDLPAGSGYKAPCYGCDLECLREQMIVFLYRFVTM